MKRTHLAVVDYTLAAGRSNRFEDMYFNLNQVVNRKGDLVKSRNGDTREILNFKTILDTPGFRCVGGFSRDVNIFFLMAEALWIWAGRKDVMFLEIFNSRMKDYSDDGKYFHAPYGWRMRNHGVPTSFDATVENRHAIQGKDQIEVVLQMLESNTTDRRAAIQIWGADQDLGVNSKDIPCNDFLMFKVRDGELYTTVQNRSNDLHWGLLTNVFQFSFVTEMMAQILELRAGQQVHNSQSLHVYTELELNTELLRNYETPMPTVQELYNYCIPTAYNPMSFSTQGSVERLHELDFHIKSIILNLVKVWNGELPDFDYVANHLASFSPQLLIWWDLLYAYVVYKRSKNKQAFYTRLVDIYTEYGSYDVIVLALNFFFKRNFEAVERLADSSIENTELSPDLYNFWVRKYLF